MKNKINYLLLMIITLSFYNCTINNAIIFIDPNLSNPNKIIIAIIPTKVEGNPNISTDIVLTDKFSLGLKYIGFQIIDRTFVESWLIENNIDRSNELTMPVLKSIQKYFKADAVLITQISYQYIPETSTLSNTNIIVAGGDSASSNSNTNTNSSNSYYNNRPRSTGAFYMPKAQSLKLVDALNEKLLIDATVSPMPQDWNWNEEASEQILYPIEYMSAQIIDAIKLYYY